MSKATVAFHVQQPALEEPAITVVGISPGMCDTGMVKGLMEGESCKFSGISCLACEV